MLAAQCPGCGYTYDVVAGDEREGFAAGTAWADVPDGWCCPDCGVREKVDFVPASRPDRAPGRGLTSRMALERPSRRRPPRVVTMRERVIDAAVALTTESGWAAGHDGPARRRVGVSRQTVYNEIGSKPRLAEAMILRELERFLGLVDRRLRRPPDDLVAAIRGACRGVLEAAQDNLLLKAVVSATHGADTELLPLLTTHAEPLLATAKDVVRSTAWRRTTSSCPPPSSTPPSTWSSAWCSATSCSPRPARRPPPTTSPGSRGRR